MPPANKFQAAMAKRSLNTVKAELDFLTEASIITPQQLSEILHILPEPTSMASNPNAATQPPTPAIANLSLSPTPTNNEKQANGGYHQPSPSPIHAPQQPPPAYPVAPNPPFAAPTPIGYATAVYAYAPSDAGDLALQPHDRVAVTEYMNADWWKGRSERTGMEGIFPRSYVRVDEVKSPGDGYGNMPLEVSQGGGAVEQVGDRPPSKAQEQGKKFGKKLGNAAIFGAGASIGSNIVNGIL